MEDRGSCCAAGVGVQAERVRALCDGLWSIWLGDIGRDGEAWLVRLVGS